MSEINEKVITKETAEEPVDTHEYVTVGGESFQAESITTGTDSISFTLAEIPLLDAVETFSKASELKVSGEDLQPYGVYQNPSFAFAQVEASGMVTIKYHIATPEEIRLARLEQTQAEQDEVLAEIIGGGIK